MTRMKDGEPRRGIREKLYSHIRVSVRTMDRIIAAIAVLLFLAIVLGIVQGNR